MKRYDRPYYTRWYRSRKRVVTTDELRRKVHLAVSAAEFVLGREIRSVLDVGCGEAHWRGALSRVRRQVTYVGVDRSEYVVRRYGKRRGIRAGSFGTLDSLRLGRQFDLIVCADVIHYVPTGELRRGLAAMRRLARGVVYIEAFAAGDDFVGDREGWHPRSPRTYREALRAAGFVACGLNCWLAREQLYRLSALERCG